MKISLQFFAAIDKARINGLPTKKKMFGTKEVLMEYWNGNLVYKKGPIQLAAPVITKTSDSVIQWTAIENVGSYSLLVDSTTYTNVAGSLVTSLDLSTLTDIPVGTHIVKLRADPFSGDTGHISSEWSNGVTYVVELPQLDTPTLSVSQHTLFISSDDDNTEEYLVTVTLDDETYVDETTVTRTGSTTNYDLDNLGLEPGSYLITAVAQADGYRDSEESEPVEYNALYAWPTPETDLSGDIFSTDYVEGVTKYKVYIDGEFVGYITPDNLFSADVAYTIDGNIVRLNSDYEEIDNDTGTTARIL